jgi:DNA-binding transcriptional MerR regulator
LRYYEDLGLVPPAGRTDAGYRVYDESSLARLAFISRAKQLGCSLDEIAALVQAWDSQRCEPVQERLRELVEAKLADARDRIVELEALTGQLQEAAAELAGHTPDGPCDDRCGCVAAAPATTTVRTRVTLGRVPRPRPTPTADDPPIACTLDPAELDGRRADWQQVLAPVREREPIAGGVRLVLPAGVPLGPLGELVTAEQRCCGFFRFALTVDERGVGLEVTAPETAADLVDELFGRVS